jgi:hypothetical protein
VKQLPVNQREICPEASPCRAKNSPLSSSEPLGLICGYIYFVKNLYNLFKYRQSFPGKFAGKTLPLSLAILFPQAFAPHHRGCGTSVALGNGRPETPLAGTREQGLLVPAAIGPLVSPGTFSGYPALAGYAVKD